MVEIARAWLLLVAANGIPWALGRVFGERWATPLDFGLVLYDGQRLLGSHKTWRGLIAGTLVCGLAASLMGLDVELGIGFGALALLGDVASSALKRRMKLAPGREILIIDQLPESLLPLFAFRDSLGLGADGILIAALLFAVTDVAAARFRRN